MPQNLPPDLKQQLLSATFRPAITLWNRLEGRPRQADFDRSLRAEVRDALWMLTRQWQLGEFRGEDSGSAHKARVQLSTSRLDRFAVKATQGEAAGTGPWAPAVAFDANLPLEAQVEREALLAEEPDPASSQLALRSQMGRHWLRLLRQAGLPHLAPAFVQHFAFEDILLKADPSPAEQLERAHLQSDRASWQALQAVRERLPDGGRLLAALEGGEFEAWADAQLEPAVRPAVKDLGQDFRRWFHRLYAQPQAGQAAAWAPSYLEHQFAVAAPADSAGEAGPHTVLAAEQYHHGRLDWYSFDLTPDQALADAAEGPAAPAAVEAHAPLAFLPAPAEFKGMPNVRWWEFEDQQTDFGSLRAGTTDLPLLMLAEFGLVYGNDWSIIPYDLEVGALAQIMGIVVTDVFGVRTLIRPAIQGSSAWSMFDLTMSGAPAPIDPRLLVLAALADVQESVPLEKVILARDEMANLVWGVEARIPGLSGQGLDGYEAATALSNYFKQQAPPGTTEPTANNARVRYVLGTSVPENWIPFIARHKPGSNREIRLQRAALPRLGDGLPGSPVEPRGRLMRTGLDGVAIRQVYFVHEEEVPRAGVTVTRRFRRTRWFDGKVVTWLGRRKQTGRGQGASGLAFDQIVPTGAPD